MSEYSFDQQSSFTLDSGSTYRYYGPDSQSQMNVRDAIERMGKTFYSFSGTENKRCKSLGVDIFDVPLSDLNDHDMSSFIPWYQYDGMIYAYYDSKHSEPGRASVIITYDESLSEYQRSYLLAHEMAHYWQEMHCMNDSEDLSKAYGVHFVNQE
tara:strand:- start:2074 stop:2535 length:462 start_codon:yes stop_codon:yes gene_type:complete